jgi:hypothetical protein
MITTTATSTTATSTQDSKVAGRSRRTRGLRRAALVVTMAAAATVSSVAAADAVVNTGGAPTHTYHLSGTDCNALVGAVKTTTGAVMGGVDVTCGTVHQITARAVEYRWNGVSWQSWSSGNFTAHSSYLSVHTGAICGGGYAQWYTAAYVTIGGLSYGPLNSSSSTSGYAPPNC